MIAGNIIGAILKNPETIILRTEEGTEHAAAMTAEEVVLTGTTEDVRLGKTVALQKGVATGSKIIPSYHTTQGQVAISNGESYKVPKLDSYNRYDFTKLQIIICEFNSSLSDSVSVHTVSIDNNVYGVNSTTVIGEITANHDDKTIDLGVMNNTGKLQILRFFTYKEI